mgnify:CR=1 FL=1
MHFVELVLFFYLLLDQIKITLAMENYIITLGTYVILMIFFKIYVAVSGKE